MKALLTRAQILLMRTIGLRKLRDGLDAKSEAVQADLAARLDTLSAGIASRGTLGDGEAAVVLSRLDALSNQISQQGRSVTERGDTDQNTLRQIRSEIEALRRSIDAADSLAPALGELRAEISSLRADFAREAEMTGEQARSRESAATDSLALALGEFRAEISSLRADFAREAELMSKQDGGRKGVASLTADLP